MDEPRTLGFNRQLGAAIYLFWIVEPADLGAVMGAVCVNMMLFESYWLLLWTVFFYLLFVTCLRAGRPRGFDRHFLRGLASPRFLRPARTGIAWHVRIPRP